MAELEMPFIATASQVLIPPISGDGLVHGTTLGGPPVPLGDISASRHVSFRLQSIIGEGGMGVVYRAEQELPQRMIALKVIKGSLADTQARKRFAREIEIMARLSHRGIAQLHFAGILEDQAGASPFMAMEFVQGVSVIEFAEQNKLSTTQRLELFATICQIVAYAHDQGVVHRDLKPSNILVDREGQPKVLDFGLAGAAHASRPGESFVTMAGQVFGTLEYMSPEQAEGRIGEIDQTSDVFALGIVLYELLSQQLPFKTSGMILADAVKIINESSPTRLSQINHSLRGDLEIIVHKALSKEKSGRYSTVRAFEADIRRFLLHEPIHARPPSLIYQASRFIRRHRLLVSSVSTAIVALTMGLGIAVDQAFQKNALSIQYHNEAVRADNAARLANEQTLLAEAENYRNKLLLADSHAGEGNLMFVAGQYFGLREHYQTTWQEYDLLHAPVWRAQLGIWQLNRICAIPLRVFDSRKDQLACGAISPDQRLIARAFASGLVEIRDVVSNEKSFEAHLPTNVNTLGFSPDGKHLLATTYDLMEIWRIQDKVKVGSIQRDSAGRFARLGNDRIVYPTSDGILRVESFDGKTLVPGIQFHDAPARDVQFAGGITYVITQHWHVLRIASGEAQFGELGAFQAANNDEACFSPDAQHIALAHKTELVIVNTSDSVPSRPIPREAGHFGFAGNDAVYVAKGAEAPLEIFDFAGKRLRLIPTSGYVSAVMSRDVALTSSSATARSNLWSLRDPPQIRSLYADSAAHALTGTISGDGYIAAVASDDGKVVLKDTQGARTLRVLDVGGKALSAAFSGDLHWLAVATETQVQLWDLLKGDPPFRFDFPRILHLELSCKGDMAVMFLPMSQQIIILRYKNGQWQKQESPVKGSVHAIRIASDSSSFIVVDSQNRGQLWKVGQTAEFVGLIASSSIEDSASAKGELALTPSTSKNRIALWNLTSGIQVGELPPTPGSIYDVAVSSAGIGVAIDSTFVYFFDLRKCQLLCQLPHPIKSPVHVRLNADGSKVLLVGQSGGAAIMDLSIPAALRALPEQPGAPMDSNAKPRDFYTAGLTEQTLPSYLDHPERILKSPTIADGFAFRDANDVKAADHIFRDSPNLSEGTKVLLESSKMPRE